VLDLGVGLPGSWIVAQTLWPAFLVALGIAIVAHGRAPSPQPPPAARARRTRRVLAGGLVVFGLAWLADAAGLVSVPWPILLPITLAAVGIATFSMSDHQRWSGPARLTAATVLSLSLVALTGVPYEGGFGERLIRPPRFGALAPQHQLAVGVLTLDLRHLHRANLPLSVTAGGALPRRPPTPG
jgi:hypothetical protein